MAWVYALVEALYFRIDVLLPVVGFNSACIGPHGVCVFGASGGGDV